MCGIAGASRLTAVTRAMIPHLAWEIEARGKDSWGMTNGYSIVKHLGPITATFSEASGEWPTWDCAIIHTRAASTGAVTIGNQHPFVTEATDDTRPGWFRRIIGIHNGIVANHHALNHTYNRTFECDSPHVFAALNGFSSPSEIEGYGNLAWYEITSESEVPALNLLKFNAENLNVARLVTGEFVFCSYRDPIIRSAMMAGSKVDAWYDLIGDTRYRIELGDADENGNYTDVLLKCEPIRFGGRHNQATNVANWYNHTHGDHGVVRTFQGRGNNAGTRLYPVTGTATTVKRNGNLNLLGTKDREEGLCMISSCNDKVEGGSRYQRLICAKHLESIMTPPATTTTKSLCTL